jgi:chemotaxis protein methyltransferase CheR
MTTDPPRQSTSAPFVGADFPDAEFTAVCNLLMAKRAFDLGSYKDRCIKRRIASRVRARGCPTAAAYLELLQGDDDELDTLLSVLTIHVSHFFRNPSTFRVLEETVLPALIERARQTPGHELRIWSAGCSSGEEVYSLALLLHELPTAGLHLSLLGTDISPNILSVAEQGEFDAQRLSEVPEVVRTTYFERLEQTRFRLRDELRDMVNFEWQNLLADEPYPASDLVLCRNVLIYFSREEQSQIMARFAACLGPGGFLVLGRAETMVGSERHLFRSDYPVERIYRCLATPDGRQDAR